MKLVIDNLSDLRAKQMHFFEYKFQLIEAAACQDKIPAALLQVFSSSPAFSSFARIDIAKGKSDNGNNNSNKSGLVSVWVADNSTHQWLLLHVEKNIASFVLHLPYPQFSQRTRLALLHSVIEKQKLKALKSVRMAEFHVNQESLLEQLLATNMVV